MKINITKLFKKVFKYILRLRSVKPDLIIKRGGIKATLQQLNSAVYLKVNDNPRTTQSEAHKTVSIVLADLPLFDIPHGSVEPRLFFDCRLTETAGSGSTIRVLIDIVHATQQATTERKNFSLFLDDNSTKIVVPLDGVRGGDTLRLTYFVDRKSCASYEASAFGFICPAGIFRWNGKSWVLQSKCIERRWIQRDDLCVLETTLGEFVAQMPIGWELSTLSSVQLRVAEHFLLSSIEQKLFGHKPYSDLPEILSKQAKDENSKSGSVDLLAYSAGEDSTAASALLPPNTKKYFCKRNYGSYRLKTGQHIKLQDFGPLEAALNEMVGALTVPNDFEMIGLAYGFRHGYGHNFGYAAIGVLLSEHLQARSISFGSVMEQVFLGSGNNYLDIVKIPTSRANMMKRSLALIGLDICFPTGGTSEVVTNLVARASPLGKFVVSCAKADEHGAPCGVCFKCFRKLRLQGIYDHQSSEAVENILSDYPLKSATSLMYAVQKSGYSKPSLDRYMDTDLEFLRNYHDYAVDHLVPPYLQAHIRQSFAQYGIQPMSPADERRLRSIGQVFWPEKFDEKRAGLSAPVSSNGETLKP